jgi:hypothetical protein
MGVGGQRHAPAALRPGKNPVPVIEEAWWAEWSVWTGAEKIPNIGARSPARAARSNLLYRLSYPDPLYSSYYYMNKIMVL